MTIITEVRFAHEHGALVDTLTSHVELKATIIREAGTNPERSVYYLGFDGVDSDDIREALATDHTVRAFEPLPGFEERGVWEVEFTTGTKLLGPMVTDHGGFVLDARSQRMGGNPRGWHERWVLPDHEAIYDVWQRARENGFEFEILDYHPRSRADAAYPGADRLTDAQRTALVTAYERGYFSEPREASLEELADALERSPSAVGGRLKRGLRSLVGMTLVVDGADK